MRVRIVVRLLWPGGVQRTLLAEAQELTNLGHTIDLVFLRKSDLAVDYGESVPYTIFRGPASKPRPLAYLFRMITSHYAPERGHDATVDLDLLWAYELQRWTGDLTLYGDQHAAMFAPLFSALRKRPYVVHIHESAFKGDATLWRTEERIALSRAAAIVANTDGTRSTLMANGYPNVTTVYPGTAIHRQVPDFADRSDMAISCTLWDVGRHPEIFIAIAREMSSGTVELVGSWTDQLAMTSFIKRVNESGLSHRLRVSGPISQVNLEARYRSAKVAIRFGYNEMGPGMGSLEAISYGVPLIYNAGIGVKEVLRDGVHGRLVDPERPASVAKAIEDLFQDSSGWRSMSANCLTAAKNLSWESHGRRLEAVLLEAARSK
jgi:glycosyltransferase involved in cell wall biosynthesis